MRLPGLVALAALVAAPAFAENYGGGIGLTAETPLSDVIRRADDLGDEPVLVRGRVTDVCQRKGCWTIIRDGNQQVRVRFKDYGFFLPTDCTGREALVEGVVEVKTLSEDMARHYEEEARAGDPGAVRGPRREVLLVASGVQLLPR